MTLFRIQYITIILLQVHKQFSKIIHQYVKNSYSF